MQACRPRCQRRRAEELHSRTGRAVDGIDKAAVGRGRQCHLGPVPRTPRSTPQCGVVLSWTVLLVDRTVEEHHVGRGARAVAREHLRHRRPGLAVPFLKTRVSPLPKARPAVPSPSVNTAYTSWLAVKSCRWVRPASSLQAERPAAARVAVDLLRQLVEALVAAGAGRRQEAHRAGSSRLGDSTRRRIGRLDQAVAPALG